ncbi:MAG: cytochrome P450 [Planctomycetes bacterium]|nr:cytochrome P450 [Planctomycetota bacterium]
MSIRTKLFQRVHSERFAPYAALPGPAPTFPLGNWASVGPRAPWEAGLEIARKHGDLALIWFGTRPIVHIASPELARTLLIDHQDALERESAARLVGLPNLPLKHRAEHGRLWEGAHPGIHSLLRLGQDSWGERWLAEQWSDLEGFFSERARAFAREGMGGSLPLHASLLRIVFSALTRMTLGQELSHQSFEDLLDVTLGSRRSALGFGRTDRSSHLQDDAHTRLFNAIATRVAQAQRYPEENRRDLLGQWIENADPATEAHWAPAILQLLVSGCQPIAASLTHTLHLVAQSTDELKRLETEILDHASSNLPHDLAALSRLDAVHREGLRFAPPIPLIARRVTGENGIELNGMSIPPGTGILINLAAMQRQGNFGSDADHFRPDRWLEAQGNRVPRSFLPGGLGPMSCPAERLREVLGKQILYSLLREHTLQTAEAGRGRWVQGVRIPSHITARLRGRRTAPSGPQTQGASATPSDPAPAPELRPEHVRPRGKRPA